MNTYIRKFWFVIAGAFILFTACSEGDMEIDNSVTVPVSVEEVKLQPIEQFVETTGTVRAMLEVELLAENEGYYRLGKNRRGKPFQLGDAVKKGDVIVYLENPELENSTMIESQELELEISKQEFEKQQALYEKGGVTLRELKNAEQAFINAQYNYENALITLSKLKVTAPFDGIIVDLPYYTPGTKVSAGSSIVKIMNYERLYLDVNFPGKIMGQIQTDQYVRALNYTLPDDTLSGKITQTSPAIDEATRTFKASVELENTDLLFRPGMFVKIETIVAKKDSAVVIPKNIIIESRNSKRVFIVERGAANDRRIEIGLENPQQVEVVEGLDVGDRLVVKGYETLSERTKVKIVR